MIKTFISFFQLFAVATACFQLVNAACVDNATRCATATTWQQCSNNVWYTHPVPSGTVCDDSSGSVSFVVASSVCQNGAQRCKPSGGIRTFEQCSNNVWYTKRCPVGTKCSASGNEVTCVTP